MAEVLARPVAVTGDIDASTGATGVAPAIGTLVLWISAMAIYAVLDPILRRRQYAATTPVGLAGRALLPGLGLAAAQVAVLGLLFWMLGVQVASPWAGAAIGLAAAFSFTMLNHGLISAFGRRGVVTALVLTVLQVASMGTLLPIQTAPEVPRRSARSCRYRWRPTLRRRRSEGRSPASARLSCCVWAALGFGLAVAGRVAARACASTNLRRRPRVRWAGWPSVGPARPAGPARVARPSGLLSRWARP